MMKFTLNNNTLKPKEWICIAAGLFLAGVIYTVMIHPSLQLFADLEKARDQKYQATKELDETQARLDELEKLILTAKKKLADVGGSPPTEYEKDALIAQLTGLAGESQIIIDRYSPIDTIEETDHRAFFVQFVGRGSFDSFKRYFTKVETRTDYIDVTHFTVTADNKNDSSGCLLTWSCRINGMRLFEDKHEQPAKPTVGNTKLMEVALHEQ
ncbi:MAG: hypothetical protein ACYTBZ_01790 [Planctomycetota bacterium]|jgi:Tfp pilus assembly protein PilO